METIDNQVAIINNSIEVFKTAPAVLSTHQARASKALVVAKNIIQQWNDAYALTDTEQRRAALEVVDKRSNDFLANCSKASTDMQESRKAITQLMDELKKMYTAEENKIDPKKGELPSSIQTNRNKYAKELHEEQEQQRKLAEAKAAKSKEAVEIEAYLNNAITQCLLNYLAERKRAINNSFNLITLENFEEKSSGLKAMSMAFPVMKLGEILKYTRPYMIRHTDADYLVIEGSVREKYDFDAFYSDYATQMGELKQILIDRLPSKKQELEAMAAASENDRIRLENEKANREAAEKRRLEEEAEANRKRADEAAEMAKAAGTAQVLFDQVSDSTILTPAPETRSGYEITVTHPPGWVEIFQFWFSREGCKMSPEDMGKKSLNQMKTYVEGCAKRNEEKIESKFLRYETSIKATNRKAVAK